MLPNPHAHLQTMTKTPVKLSKDWHKTVGGVAHKRYPLSIHFDSVRAWKMTKFKIKKKKKKKKKTTNINLRIISQLHARLQTMTKAPVKFQKDRHKTVGGAAHTRYLLLEGNRITELRKAEYYSPSLFFEKAGDNKSAVLWQGSGH